MQPLKPNLTRIEALQFLSLGIALGNKSLRSKFKPSMFAFEEFQRAIAGLKDGTEYSNLSRILTEQCNVPWEASKDSPIELIIQCLERDGRFAAAIDVLNTIIDDTCNMNSVDYRKDEFVERLLRFGESVEQEREKVDDPVRAMKREEEHRKAL